MDGDTVNEARSRLERLLGYLDADRDNLQLATDCAEAALAADQPEMATAVLAPFDAAGLLSDTARNLAGIAAMRGGDQLRAQRHFTLLLERQPDDSTLQFNLAWSLALLGHEEEARTVLGDVTRSDLPQAALLDLQLDHRLGELERAEAKLDGYLDRFPDYAPLQSTASMLAMDMDMPDLARSCAERGGEHPDALATLGALELGESRLEDARALFTRSLSGRDVNPRAAVGLGLVELASGDARAALPHLDRGAEQFGDHLGSWIAAGWAYFIAGDLATARARFETALAKDDTFGEAHGSLAVADALAGDVASARRRMEVARRLDRQSFSVALAEMILSAADGDSDRAQRILDTALRQPIMPDGRTLAQALARSAL